MVATGEGARVSADDTNAINDAERAARAMIVGEEIVRIMDSAKTGWPVTVSELRVSAGGGWVFTLKLSVLSRPPPTLPL